MGSRKRKEWAYEDFEGGTRGGFDGGKKAIHILKASNTRSKTRHPTDVPTQAIMGRRKAIRFTGENGFAGKIDRVSKKNHNRHAKQKITAKKKRYGGKLKEKGNRTAWKQSAPIEFFVSKVGRRRRKMIPFRRTTTQNNNRMRKGDVMGPKRCPNFRSRKQYAQKL